MSEIGRRQIRAGIDIIALLWITVAFFEFAYLTTYVEMDLTIAVKGLVGLSLLIGGLVLSSTPSFGVGVALDVWISGRELINWIIGVFVSFTVILLMNGVVNRYSPIYVQTALSFTPIGGATFAMLIGISEEVGIRGYLLNLLSNISGSDLLAIAISSTIGATMHAAIYGARDPTVLITVLVSFAILGFVYATSTEAIKGPFQREPVPSRRISMIMTGHALVNLFAMWRGA